MSIKISQLPVAPSITNTAIVPIVQNSETQQANISQLSDAIVTNMINLVPVSATSAGDFNVAHYLGMSPIAVVVQMTSDPNDGSIWLQPSPSFDDTYLYLTSNGGNISNPSTATAIAFI